MKYSSIVGKGTENFESESENNQEIPKTPCPPRLGPMKVPF